MQCPKRLRMVSSAFEPVKAPKPIFPRVHGNPIFSTRLISLSKPHPKVIKIISNNSKNNAKHKKIEKHKMESEMKFYLRQRLQPGAKNVPSMKHLAAIFLCRLFIVKQLPIL